MILINKMMKIIIFKQAIRKIKNISMTQSVMKFKTINTIVKRMITKINYKKSINVKANMASIVNIHLKIQIKKLKIILKLIKIIINFTQIENTLNRNFNIINMLIQRKE